MSTTSEPVVPYIKIRRQFGRQMRVVHDRFRVHCNILTNKSFRKKYIRYRILHKEVQACKPWSESEVNTIAPEVVSSGVTHIEGGWPKELNLDDPEVMLRYRKKLEKDTSYQASLPIMYNKMERYVKQNNALNIYGDLFKKKWKHKDPHKKTPKSKMVHIYEDASSFQRAVKKIIWAPDSGKFGVCHVPPIFSSALRESPTEAYFWDVELASRPESQLRSDSHIMDINFHNKDIHSICGACFDGTVVHWDNRVGYNPIAQTPLEISHEDVCTGVRWVASKTNTELFSSGMDGQVIWWDARNFSERLDSVWLDPEKGNNRKEMATPATVLEYEQSVPTKFLAGAENGGVFLMMRKGKSPADKLINLYKAHLGPVLNIQRNPFFVKNFLTVGDNTCKIFTEDCRDSPIMWTAPKDVLYTHASWIPSRPSNFVVTRNDGFYEIFDLVKDAARPYLVVRVQSSHESKTKTKKIAFKRELMDDTYLTCASPCDAPSKLVAIGSSKGNIYMQKLSESLYMSEKFDKPLLAQIFERETRRQKLIEQRHREIRLRKREKEKGVEIAEKLAKDRAEFAEKLAADAAAEGKTIEPPDYSKNYNYDIEFEARNQPVAKAEREFYNDLEREIEEKGIEAFAEFQDQLAESGVKRGSLSSKQLDSALDITAADLAAFAFVEEEEVEYDEDGHPIKKEAKEAGAPKTEADTAAPVAAEAAPPAAPEAPKATEETPPPPPPELEPAPAATEETTPPPPDEPEPAPPEAEEPEPPPPEPSTEEEQAPPPEPPTEEEEAQPPPPESEDPGPDTDAPPPEEGDPEGEN